MAATLLELLQALCSAIFWTTLCWAVQSGSHNSLHNIYIDIIYILIYTFMFTVIFGTTTSSATSIVTLASDSSEPVTVPPVAKSSTPVPPVAKSSKPVQLVAGSSTQQQQVVPKRRAQPRMIYGFTFSHDELVEWGIQHFGEDDKAMQHFLRACRAMGPLFTRCYHLWRQTTRNTVTYYSGPRRGEEDWCLTLADNISLDTVTPLPESS
jgi:hypothetical protein